ncbi:MAG: MMPL family transporter [Planctomycetota bacterium]
MGQHKLSSKLLRAVGGLVVARPGWIALAYLFAVAASVWVAATRLQLKTDQNDLVSADLPYNRRYLKYIDTFGDLEYLYVVIVLDEYERGGRPLEAGPEGPEGDAAGPAGRGVYDPLQDRQERAIELAEEIVRELSPLRDYLEEAVCRVHPRSFGDSVLLLGTKEELEELVERVEENSGLLRGLSEVNSFPAFFRFVVKAIDPSMAQSDPEAAEWGFRFLSLTLESILRAARGEEPPRLEDSIEKIALGPGRDPKDRGYMFAGSLALVEVMPEKNYETLEVIREPLAKIREALERVRARHLDRYGDKALKFGLTGRPVLQADEMQTTDADMRRATVLALVGVLLLFVAFFRRLRRPLLAVLSLVAGIAITFGIATVTIGYLTLLSVVFTVMLVGLGIDFGVHFLARYQEELRRTGEIEPSVRTTLVSSGLAIWTGGITTAVAFYSTMLVNFRGLAELGFVAGTGLLVCMASMLTLLPSLVVLTDRRIARRRGLQPPRPIVLPFLSSLPRYAPATIGALGVLTVLGLARFRGVPYNWNLLDLQAKGLPSVDFELKLIEKSDRSTWEAAFLVDGLDAVDETIRRLEPWRERGVVGLVESIRDFVQKDQEEKIRALRPVAEVLEGLRLPEPAEAFEPEEMRAAAEELLERLDHVLSLVAGRESDEDRQAREAVAGLIAEVEKIRDLVEEAPEVEGKRLAAYQRRWFEEVRSIFNLLRRLASPPPIAVRDIPEAVRRRYVSKDGSKFLVRAYPGKDVWKEDNMKEFVSAILEVDPQVTGVALQVYESARLMKQGFLWAAFYSLVAVFFLILIDFRDLRLAGLTLVPLVVGLTWALELMPVLGLDFNLANFFALPILVGYGVAGGVHVIHRYLECGSAEELGRTVSSAVALSFLTTIVGFGSLAIAQHRGVASLGRVTSLGCALVLVASIVLLPCLLAVAGRRPAPARPCD